MIILFTNHHHGSHQILSRKSKQNHNTWSNRFTSAQILSINRPHRKLLIVEQRNPKTCVTVPLEKDGATLLTVLLNIHARLPFFFLFLFFSLFSFSSHFGRILNPSTSRYSCFFNATATTGPFFDCKRNKYTHVLYVELSTVRRPRALSSFSRFHQTNARRFSDRCTES